MKQEHTPGPWSVGTSTSFGIHCVDAIDPIDGQLFEVCEVWGINVDTEEDAVSHANARLIAAAPELLEALKELCDAIHSHGFHFDPSLKTAEAVITKATRGTP